MKNNRLDLYKRTTDKLFNAYFNDELRHGSCSACAVGNILDGQSDWSSLFQTYKHRENINSPLEIINKRCREGEIMMDGMPTKISDLGVLWREIYTHKYNRAMESIEKSGYSLHELQEIEFTFEAAEDGKSDEDYMFNGLVAVLDKLKEIHEIDDNSEEKKRFSEEHHRKLEIA